MVGHEIIGLVCVAVMGYVPECHVHGSTFGEQNNACVCKRLIEYLGQLAAAGRTRLMLPPPCGHSAQSPESV